MPNKPGSVIQKFQRNIKIFRRFTQGETPSEIAPDYNLEPRHIYRIIGQMEKNMDELIINGQTLTYSARVQVYLNQYT